MPVNPFQSINFNRPPRIQLPALPTDEVELPAPPTSGDLPDQNILITILPVLGIGVMAIFYVFRAATDNNSSSAFFAVPMLLLAFFTIGGTVLAQRWRRREYQRRRDEQDMNYRRLLERKQVRLQAARDAQIALLETQYFPTNTLLRRAFEPDERFWERRPEDKDFLWVRLGLGRVPSSVPIRPPTPDSHTDALERALKLADAYRYLPDAPMVVSLVQDWSLGVYGNRAQVNAALRALLCQMALTHTPQDVQMYYIGSQASQNDWRWLKWLPHTGLIPGDNVAFTPEQIRNLSGALGQMIDERRQDKAVARLPHLLVILDNPPTAEYEAVYNTLLREGYLVGASVICPGSRFEDIPGDCRAVMSLSPDAPFGYRRADGYELAGTQIDALPPVDAEHVARAIASVNLVEAGSTGRIPQRVDFLELYSARYADDLIPRIADRWHRPIQRGVLPHPVPIGRESHAQDTLLLLDEENHGPHGVLAGTTGSGKSELLQTLVSSLAIEHDPRLLTLLLIDFKGGSTFNVFADLPHTVGMVTNLDGARIRRVLEALKAEIQWRQQFLKYVNVRDITQYHRYFSRSPEMMNQPEYQPLPHLFIIVDEFAQLAREMPDFLRELVRTAQIGRSLGLHLILGTQSPMDVITDEMNANLQFRICLRVQNIEASRAMLRRPDAAYLPANQPGRGYFQVGERGVFKQFQTAYAGGDYLPALNGDDTPRRLELITERGQTVNLLADDAVYGIEIQPFSVARAVAEAVTKYARQQGIARQRPLLLPPLEERITLADAAQRIAVGGWNGRIWRKAGLDEDGNAIRQGSAPIGLIDDVFTRAQHPLWIHLNAGEQERGGKDGHVLVVGAPGTGKTMFLRTLALSLALLHAPDALHLYCLSFTGTGLHDLGYMPHADRVIYGNESERMRRLFGRLIHALEDRQANPAKAFRPTIALFIDQFEQFREMCRDTHLSDFERLINEGRAVGIYIVFTASSITAVPDRIRSLVQQRIALQAGNPGDYILTVGRTPGAMDDHLPPGRGYLYDSPPLLCQIALPTRSAAIADEQEALQDWSTAIHEMRRGYLALKKLDEDGALPEQQQSPAPITELPTHIPLHVLPLADSEPEQIVTIIGRTDDDTLSSFALDWWQAGPDFVVVGAPGSGKTNLLHVAVLAAAQQYSPQQVRFLLVDFTQRSLRALTPLRHVIKRVTDAIELRAQLLNLQAEMNAFYAAWRDNEKLGAQPVMPATVIVIDDYDATAEALSSEPELLRQLRDHVRLHSDLGLYLWVSGYLDRVSDPLMKQLLLRRAGFGMMTKESLQKLYVRTTGLSNEAMPVGRAYFPQHNQMTVVQTALIENPAGFVQRVNTLWTGHNAARWLFPANKNDILSQFDDQSLRDEFAIDIDTPGLIQDLLGGQFADDDDS
jgi:DNA segregation ATPase FtsK/SpoIIIE, S-DNA-T family